MKGWRGKKSRSNGLISVEDYRLLLEKQEPKPNRKIINAHKIVRDDIKFDSRLEMFMHDLLTINNIPFEFQKKYVLLPAFQYRDEGIRSITLTVDFVLPGRDIIIDTKGFFTQQGSIKYKYLKHYFLKRGESPRMEFPSNKGECTRLIRKILEQ